MAGLHMQGGIDHSLQPGSTATVQGVAGDLQRQAGRQCGIATHAGCLARGVGLRDDHFVQRGRGDVQALQQGLDDAGSKLVGAQRAQGAAELADGRAQG
ncbi:hypothetical protein FQZ97_764980 [compost metagenome]